MTDSSATAPAGVAAASTGFCRDFALSVQEGVTFNDNEPSFLTGLSIGEDIAIQNPRMDCDGLP